MARSCVCLEDIPPAVCQTFYGLGQLRGTNTPDVLQDFYFYIGIFSLSLDIAQPGCDGSNTDFPTQFQNNVRIASRRALLDTT